MQLKLQKTHISIFLLKDNTHSHPHTPPHTHPPYPVSWAGKQKSESASHVQLSVTPQIVANQDPLSKEFPGKYTGVGSQFLLQGILLTQGSNPGLLHCVLFASWATMEAQKTKPKSWKSFKKQKIYRGGGQSRGLTSPEKHKHPPKSHLFRTII